MSELTRAIRNQHLRLTEQGRYAEHAAPESVAAYLADAVQALDELQEHVRWLSALHGRRTAEKNLGSWPPGLEATS